MGIYPPWLRAYCTDLGVRFVQREARSLDEALDARPLVANCTGLASREMAHVAALMPIRGWVLRVAPRLARTFVLDEHVPEGLCYVVPRARCIVLGSSASEGRGTSIRTRSRPSRSRRPRRGTCPVSRQRTRSGSGSACGRIASRYDSKPNGRGPEVCSSTTTTTPARASRSPWVVPRAYLHSLQGVDELRRHWNADGLAVAPRTGEDSYPFTGRPRLEDVKLVDPSWNLGKNRRECADALIE